jgi:hypothetical protein
LFSVVTVPNGAEFEVTFVNAVFAVENCHLVCSVIQGGSIIYLLARQLFFFNITEVSGLA